MKSMFKGAFSALVVVLALSGLTAASALAAGAPTAETRPALKVSPYEYYLAGYVNPNGVETKLYFEYGTTISYGTKTKETTTTVAHEAQKLVVGLIPNTTYHFRVVATNSYGTAYGSDGQFTTPVEPEAVVTSGKITQLELHAVGSSASIEWGAGKSLSCRGSQFSGHFINSTELEGSMRWSECYATLGLGNRTECFNGKELIEGKYVESWIQSETLKGTLGYINRAKKEVGLRLAGAGSETWAKNVACLGGGAQSLNGALGGQLSLPVNAKIPAEKSFGMVYTEKEDKQTTGELGGQLLYSGISEPFGFSGSLNADANREFEIKA